jgi:hypothetical protein
MQAPEPIPKEPLKRVHRHIRRAPAHHRAYREQAAAQVSAHYSNAQLSQAPSSPAPPKP